MTPPSGRPAICNCLALRQAARHVTQFYDRFLAPCGLRTTQYSILARLGREGPTAINRLAAALVMDRTTLGRNILPLQRDGLVTVVGSKSDRRRRELCVTESGEARLKAAGKAWREAQAAFEAGFGVKRSRELRALMREVTAAV